MLPKKHFCLQNYTKKHEKRKKCAKLVAKSKINDYFCRLEKKKAKQTK